MKRATVVSLLLVVALAPTLAGCGSLGTGAPSARLGYAHNDGVLSHGGNGQKKRLTAEAERRQRAGEAVDVTAGYGKAEKGAYAGRDYSSTRLNPVTAQQMINAYRASKGLRPLKLNEKLEEAAKEHAQDLAEHDRISHYGSDGSDPLVRVQRAGYPVQLAAENVGTGQISLAEVIRGWQDSPGHNENLLLRDAEEMGIALVIDPKTEYKTFWTLVLGAPSHG